MCVVVLSPTACILYHVFSILSRVNFYFLKLSLVFCVSESIISDSQINLPQTHMAVNTFFQKSTTFFQYIFSIHRLAEWAALTSIHWMAVSQECEPPTYRPLVGEWTARGLCRKNLWTEPIFQDIQAKNCRFVCQKYLYKKNVSSDPGDLKLRGLRRHFSGIEKICRGTRWFFPVSWGKWGLAAQKFRIDPAMIFLIGIPWFFWIETLILNFQRNYGMMFLHFYKLPIISCTSASQERIA